MQKVLSFSDNYIFDCFMSRLKSKSKRTSKEELLSYLFGKETYEIADRLSIELLADELTRNNNNIKKIDIVLRQFSIKNREEVISLLISMYEASGYIVSHALVASRAVSFPHVSEIDGLDKNFKRKIKLIEQGNTITNNELIRYLEKVRLVLLAKAMGAISKKKTKITYSAFTDSRGVARKKDAVSITEEEESLVPMEQVLPSIEEVNRMILNLQSKQSVFPTEEELARQYKLARQKSEEEKNKLLSDEERFKT